MSDGSLEARVRQLEDLEALRLLKARYCELVDTRQWQRFGELFADDCVFSSSAAMPAISGPDDFVEFDDATHPGWAGFGRYLEQYRRDEDGGWRLTSWHLEREQLRRLSPRTG